ncbi:MAG: Fic family protein [Hyphomicrobiales bacterium]|nr:Fic family protein [Hyphomicrobiales bacterium]
MAKASGEIGRTGRYVETVAGGEKARAFVPPPLPPTPPIDLRAMLNRIGRAERALGRLDGISAFLPNQELLIYMYVRKEAVLSSQIEDTQSTMNDLLRWEASARKGRPVDVREVSNYVDATTYGFARLKDFPLSLRAIRELHGRVLRTGRGAAMGPGEFRRSQNWVGGTRIGNAVYVPPPVPEMKECLDALEKYIHGEGGDLPPVVKAGLIHVQFESIHPFLDGNGRVGRLLVTLYLCAMAGLNEPILYLSLYLKSRRREYYRLLQEVRERGAWEAWIEFFLDGVAETAGQVFDSTKRIVEILKEDRERISAGGERTGSALHVHELMQKNPYLTSRKAVERTGLTAPTVNAALKELARLGIVEEVTGRKRDRVYAYSRYLEVLAEGTEPLPRGGG